MSLKKLLGISQDTTANASPPSPGKGEFDGVAPYYDHLMRAVPYRHWVDYVVSILDRYELKPRDVLDLCCGTGKVGSELATRGHQSIGLDMSEPMVRYCREQTPPIAGIVSDASHLAIKPERFDLVVSLYDSLNYILEPEMLAECFRDVYATVRPGGIFIFDMNTPRALSSGLFSQNNLSTSDPLLYSWKAHWDPRARICRVEMWFKWRNGEEEQVFEETHWQYAHVPADVCQMLGDAGFQPVEAFNAYTFRPVNRWSDRAFYAARKEQ